MITTDSGLQYEDQQEGTGPAAQASRSRRPADAARTSAIARPSLGFGGRGRRTANPAGRRGVSL